MRLNFAGTNVIGSSTLFAVIHEIVLAEAFRIRVHRRRCSRGHRNRCSSG
jgi:hypothetical protein